MNTQNWQEYITNYFNKANSDSEVEKEMTLKDMLDNYLAMVEHALQHEDGSAKFTNIEGQRCLYTKAGEDTVFIIPVEDLKIFGYIPETLQSAADFIADNWNWY